MAYMWRNWFIGALGLWIIILGFLGFPSAVQRVFMIISGLLVAIISFWRGVSEIVAQSADKKTEQAE